MDFSLHPKIHLAHLNLIRNHPLDDNSTLKTADHGLLALCLR
jgi:hypothetical protein